jgi:hypothetical protein
MPRAFVTSVQSLQSMLYMTPAQSWMLSQVTQLAQFVESEQDTHESQPMQWTHWMQSRHRAQSMHPRQPEQSTQSTQSRQPDSDASALCAASRDPQRAMDARLLFASFTHVPSANLNMPRNDGI